MPTFAELRQNMLNDIRKEIATIDDFIHGSITLTFVVKSKDGWKFIGRPSD